MSDYLKAKAELLGAALSAVAHQVYAESHPGDPHLSDSADVIEDRLIEAASAFLGAVRDGS